jgi:hypothetical protein
MKRRTSDGHHVRSTDHCSNQVAKRHRTHHADTHMLASAPPSKPSKPLSQTQALTSEALHSLQRSLSEAPRPTSHHFTSFPDVPENMSIPPTPRSASTSTRGRRDAKRHARSHSSRTPSPSKKPSPQTYRTRNLCSANVFVEALDELPLGIDEEVRRILRIKSWDDRVEASADEALVDDAAVSYKTQSLENTRDCSLEGNWKTSLFTLIRALIKQSSAPSAGELKLHVTEKGNCDVLKFGDNVLTTVN